MYGYIVPVKSKLEKKDFFLYRAFYCAMCITTGKLYGQLPRLASNYDITFFSLIMNDLLNNEVEFENTICVLNPIRKKTVVKPNALLEKIAAYNIIFAYHSIQDAIKDGGGIKKKLAASALKNAYIKAAAQLPQINQLVEKKLAQLDQLEKQNCPSIDRAAECFASLLSQTAQLFLQDRANDDMLAFFYHLGKYVYIVDALDDVAEDWRTKNYNPFLLSFGNYTTRLEFFEKNKADISFLLNITTNKMIEHFNKLVFTQSYDLLKNIVHYGFREKINELLQSKRKLPKPKI